MFASKLIIKATLFTEWESAFWIQEINPSTLVESSSNFESLDCISGSCIINLINYVALNLFVSLSDIFFISEIKFSTFKETLPSAMLTTNRETTIQYIKNC